MEKESVLAVALARYSPKSRSTNSTLMAWPLHEDTVTDRPLVLPMGVEHNTNDGEDTRTIQHDLGHRNIQRTVRSTALSVKRFGNF